MPSASIDYSRANAILNYDTEVSKLEGQDGVISTPFGLSILEIQGELNIPTEPPASDHTDAEYVLNFITVDQVYHAVKCGNLEFDAADPKKATLFIGKSQRLLGSVVNLETPLAVLKVPLGGSSEQEENTQIQMVDIIRNKIIFKQRPLPIM
ncbi:uncharacterized protein CANTADRAFT_48270 [Suhomyces tanzawaensis NRRL Y-17324]|uniref:Chromosome transmission fidelity protein 8 n=1 Tax=Suhomyces tanzawaensis NRRL Y-17324 TaxID=984487 RepID=A0A1E4SN80_9ASCO|nr:uncharacterized protein CANTADRAFT_48270 [Suhomyces tanzawaensis NRRL Y-17324]ODV80842.1 hypothetical protein CANTADRAFT_48270 [Suhomyces tanzawaensis NRRL Y-17324]